MEGIQSSALPRVVGCAARPPAWGQISQRRRPGNVVVDLLKRPPPDPSIALIVRGRRSSPANARNGRQNGAPGGKGRFRSGLWLEERSRGCAGALKQVRGEPM